MLDVRNLFESRLIVTIAQCSECKPSHNWLGRYSPVKKIRESGLWNIQYVGGDPLNQKDFMFFKELLLK